jgi:hypothetical protein
LETYIPFHLTSADYANDLPPVGQLRPEVYDAIACKASRATSNASGSSSDKPFRLLGNTGGQNESSQKQKAICFADWVIEQGKMGEVMNELASTWRKEGKFPGPLAGMSMCPASSRYSVLSIDVKAGGMNIIQYSHILNHRSCHPGRKWVHSVMEHSPLRGRLVPCLGSEQWVFT